MELDRLACALATSVLLGVCLAACADGDTPSSTGPGPHPIPSDPHEFISAEGVAGQVADSRDGGVAASAADRSAEQRTVEEGDIYRVLGPGRLLNLNPYRGLQVIDLSDVAQPKLIGRLKEAGTPVEMYVLGQRAVVLLNDWTGYWGARGDVRVQRSTGGLILNVDLSNPAAPVVLDREFVPGSIQTSRLTREGDRAALYVAGPFHECSGTYDASCSGTVIKSLDVSGNDLLPRTTLRLGGYVSAVQATPTAMIVARTSDGTATPQAKVSLVDITNVDGTMVEGAQVPISGYVQNKFNLDLRGGVLRVASGNSWFSGSRSNHLETFDARDLSRLAPIDHCTFGSGEQLFATLFLDDRAFAVTYLRTDPFHAFSIDAAGKCQERSQYVVSGWNDFFKPVMQNRRLIGIGTNDTQGRQVSVSLYDITNLDNPAPLLARADVASGAFSWSTASADDKAYSVIEDAVSIASGSDPAQIETGLVLLPYASYGGGGESARAGVQIYTFGDHTLTARGTMNHGEIVQRTFVATRGDASEVTANLSDQTLSLFDTSTPEAPVEQGRLTLAPSFSDVLDYGAFRVRVRDERARFASWWTSDVTPPPSYAEVIPSSGEPDAVEPLARVAIPAGTRVYRSDALLVAVSTVSKWKADKTEHHSEIRVFDLSDPARPIERGTTTSERLLPAYGFGWGYYGRYGFGMTCGVIDGGYYDDFSRVLPGAIVFGRNLPQQTPIGTYEDCYAYDATESQPSCRFGSSDCAWTDGYRSCSRKIDAGERVCQSYASRCERKDGKESCTPVDPETLALTEHCSTYERSRYWQSLELDVLDLRDPSAPKLTPVAFAPDEEAVGLVASGSSVYFAFKRPFSIRGDGRPFVKYFVREVGLSDPAQPQVGSAINVPGELLAVQGQQLVTRDLRWGAQTAETWLHTLQRTDDKATIVASLAYGGREVTGTLVDDAGRLLVTHRTLQAGYGGYDATSQGLVKLAILRTDSLGALGEVEVDAWADMTQAVSDRILFSVPGGMLIVNAQDVAAPFAQAYFPYVGWQRKVTFDGSRILVAAGPYGIAQLDATTHNLLPR